MRPVYAEAKTAGTIAEAVMRDALTRSLGVEWGPVRNGIAELAGVPAIVREHFSQRHAEILEEALARGYASPRGIDVIQRETRDRKRVALRERAVAEWRARAAEHGFGARELSAVVGRRHDVGRRQAIDLDAVTALMLGPAGLTQRFSYFTRREVIQALADAHPYGAPAGALEDLADRFLGGECVALQPSRVEPSRGHQEALYSTPDMLRAEVRLLEAAAGIDPHGGLVAAPEAIEAAIAVRPPLGSDQAAAVRHLCSGEARVRVLEARAGTGKTFALEAVREAYAVGGVPVIGVAWQGQAADVLQRGAGIPAQTLALLLERLSAGDDEAFPAGSVVVVDEASMVPTRGLERLIVEAAQRSARVLLVGDRVQLPAIDAAGGFAALADRLGAAKLNENRRQRTELQRRVADRLAEGRPAEAIALLAENGRLRGFDDARDARTALVEAWAGTSLADPARSLMLAHDRHEVAALNRMAREALGRAGLLGPTRLVALGREWAAGDRLVCRRNNYRLQVRNGTRGTVIGVDQQTRELRLRTDDGRDVRLPSDYLEHAHHGYALTGHISQGATVERTYLLATPERGGAEWAYVAATRQRLDLAVFVVHYDAEQLEEALARAWGRSDAKRLAIDVAAATDRDVAAAAADWELDRSLPERLLNRREALLAAREHLRAEARSRTGERSQRATGGAQSITAELRSLERLLGEWTGRAAIAHAPECVLEAFGQRPDDPGRRTTWDQGVRAVAAYRFSYGVATGEPTLLGSRPSAAEARAAWEEAARRANDSLRRLNRPAAAMEQVRRQGRSR